MFRPNGIVQNVVDVIDIDGVVQRIDINDLLKRVEWDDVLKEVDINKLIKRIDFNEVIDSVDINRVVERVDLNHLIQRIDIPYVVEQAQLPDIIARSTTSILEPFFAGVRAQLIIGDLFVWFGWIWNCTCNRLLLPSSPGRDTNKEVTMKNFVSQSPGDIGIVVQNLYVGIFSRIAAFTIDLVLLQLLLLGLTESFEFLIKVVKSEEDIKLSEMIGYRWFYVFQLVFVLVYFSTAIASSGRTLGKALVGIQVVRQEDGKALGFGRSFVRSIFICIDIISIAFFIRGGIYRYFSSYILVATLVGLLRADRRQLHDIIAKTCVVYSWDAGLSKFRLKLDEKLLMHSYQDNASAEAKPDIISLRQRSQRDRPNLTKNSTDSSVPYYFSCKELLVENTLKNKEQV